MGDHIVDAYVLPREDKHYGTQIRIVLDNGEWTDLNIWIPEGDPSDEELQRRGFDRASYETDLEVDDGWGGKAPIRSMLTCDTHYQSRYELEVCQQIVNAIKAVCGE